MSTDLMLRMSAALCVLALVLASREDFLAMLEQRRSDQHDVYNHKMVLCEQALGVRPGAEATRIRVLGADAHIVLPACANGTPFRVLLDLDAEASLLTWQDAIATGVDPETLAFDYQVAVPGGTAPAASVVLPWLQISGVMIRNAEFAVVRDGEIPMSIVGPQALRGLKTYEISDGELVLEP